MQAAASTHAAPSPSPFAPLPPRPARVYVNNLPWTTTEDELRTTMSGAGGVVNVEIYRYRDGRSKVRALEDRGHHLKDAALARAPAVRPLRRPRRVPAPDPLPPCCPPILSVAQGCG